MIAKTVNMTIGALAIIWFTVSIFFLVATFQRISISSKVEEIDKTLQIITNQLNQCNAVKK